MPFRDIDYQRILQSDWMRGTPDEVKNGSLRYYLHAKKERFS